MSKQQILDGYFKNPNIRTSTRFNSPVASTSGINKKIKIDKITKPNNAIPLPSQQSSSSGNMPLSSTTDINKKLKIDGRQHIFLKKQITFDEYITFTNMKDILRQDFIQRYPNKNDISISRKVDRQLEKFYKLLTIESNFVSKYKSFFTDFRIQPKPWLTTSDKLQLNKYKFKRLKIQMYKNNFMHDYHSIYIKTKKANGKSIKTIKSKINNDTVLHFNNMLRNIYNGDFNKTVKAFEKIINRKKCNPQEQNLKDILVNNKAIAVNEIKEIMNNYETITDITNLKEVNEINNNEQMKEIYNENNDHIQNETLTSNCDNLNDNKNTQSLISYKLISYYDNKNDKKLNQSILEILPKQMKQYLERIKEKCRQKLSTDISSENKNSKFFEYCRRNDYIRQNIEISRQSVKELVPNINYTPIEAIVDNPDSVDLKSSKDTIEMNLTLKEFREKTNIIEWMKNFIKIKDPKRSKLGVPFLNASIKKLYLTKYLEGKKLPEGLNMKNLNSTKSTYKSTNDSSFNSLDTVIFNPKERDKAKELNPNQQISLNVNFKDKKQTASTHSIAGNVIEILDNIIVKGANKKIIELQESEIIRNDHERIINDNIPLENIVNKEDNINSTCPINTNILPNCFEKTTTKINNINISESPDLFLSSSENLVSSLEYPDESYVNILKRNKNKRIAKKILEDALNTQNCSEGNTLYLSSNSEKNYGKSRNNDEQQALGSDIILLSMTTRSNENIISQTSFNIDNQQIWSHNQLSIDPLSITITPTDNENYLFYDTLAREINDENLSNIENTSVSSKNENRDNINKKIIKDNCNFKYNKLLNNSQSSDSILSTMGSDVYMHVEETKNERISSNVSKIINSADKNNSLINNATESQSLIPKEVELASETERILPKRNNNMNISVESNSIILNDKIHLPPRRKRKHEKQSQRFTSCTKLTEIDILPTQFNLHNNSTQCDKTKYKSQSNNKINQHHTNHDRLLQLVLNSEIYNEICCTQISENCNNLPDIQIKTELINNNQYSQDEDIEFIPNISKSIIEIEDDDSMDIEQMIKEMGSNIDSNSHHPCELNKVDENSSRNENLINNITEHQSNNINQHHTNHDRIFQESDAEFQSQISKVGNKNAKNHITKNTTVPVILKTDILPRQFNHHNNPVQCDKSKYKSHSNSKFNQHHTNHDILLQLVLNSEICNEICCPQISENCNNLPDIQIKTELINNNQYSQDEDIEFIPNISKSIIEIEDDDSMDTEQMIKEMGSNLDSNLHHPCELNKEVENSYRNENLINNITEPQSKNINQHHTNNNRIFQESDAEFQSQISNVGSENAKNHITQNTTMAVKTIKPSEVLLDRSKNMKSIVKKKHIINDLGYPLNKRPNFKCKIITKKIPASAKLNPNEDFALQKRHVFQPLDLISIKGIKSSTSLKTTSLKTTQANLIPAKQQPNSFVHNNIQDFSQIIEESGGNSNSGNTLLSNLIEDSSLVINKNLSTELSSRFDQSHSEHQISPDEIFHITSQTDKNRSLDKIGHTNVNIPDKSLQLKLNNTTSSQLLNIDNTFFNSSQLLKSQSELSTNLSSLEKNLVVSVIQIENLLPNIQKPAIQIKNDPYCYITYLSLSKLHLSQKFYDMQYNNNKPFLHPYAKNELIKAKIQLSRHTTKKGQLYITGEKLRFMLGINNLNWQDIKKILHNIENFKYNCFELPTNDSLLYLVLHYFFKTLSKFVQITYVYDESSDSIESIKIVETYKRPIKKLSTGLDMRVLNVMAYKNRENTIS